jgi:hypothetical protein
MVEEHALNAENDNLRWILVEMNVEPIVVTVTREVGGIKSLK